MFKKKSVQLGAMLGNYKDFSYISQHSFMSDLGGGHHSSTYPSIRHNLQNKNKNFSTPS